MNYKFEIDKCPKCGASPGYLMEWTRVLSKIGASSSDNPPVIPGTFDYECNHSEVFWDECEPIYESDGTVTVVCNMPECGHSWSTKMQNVTRKT